MSYVNYALILGLTTAALAQQHRPKFVLGQALEEMHQALGTAGKYWDVEAKRYLRPTETAAARDLGHKVLDVYTFETTQNTYEFKPGYESDGRQSRLHPTARINYVGFELDRPVETANVRTLLADFPEATAICARGCEIHELNGGGRTIWSVQPTSPSAQELQEAALISSNWGSQATLDSIRLLDDSMRKLAETVHKPHRPSVPIQTIVLGVEGQRITGGNIGVSEMAGTGVDYSLTYGGSSGHGVHGAVTVGTWQP
jgi:hypothetical protein